MSTTTEARAATEARLLYVAIDLGARPRLDAYGRNVAALLTLARYATLLSQAATHGSWRTVSSPESLPPAELRIVRTSLASPWVSILGDLARSSAPIAYGVTALYAMHRLLHLVITWQRHRLDIAERDLQLQHLRTELHLQQVLQTTKPDPSTAILEDAEPLPKSLAARLAERHAAERAERAAAVAPLEPDSAPFLDIVVSAAHDLGKIQAAEMVDPQDPRAAGTHPAEDQ